MTKKFQEQGGAATMDPSILKRWITSTFMTRLSKAQNLEKKRAKFERQRKKSGQSHVVEYFHQVDDGYSHLAAQVLHSLAQRYDIELVCHLVRGPQGKNVAEPDLLEKLSRYDSFHVAPDYALEFPEHPGEPDPALVSCAEAILAAQSSARFIQCAKEVGRALWAGDESGLQDLADRSGAVDAGQAQAKVEAGSRRREELGHYSGAMFYYGQEWYWGVDRLYHLEKRLAALGLDRHVGTQLLLPRPAIEAGQLRDNGSLTLEVYPSMRSPYTAISFDRAVELARETGVNLAVRPVLPMVMRGVPVTRNKGFYIFLDAAREAREAGVPYGNIRDPIGEPVRRCYSLYPWASERGKGAQLLSSFLRCAFVLGIDTNSDKGLQQVVENAGLDWSEAKGIVGHPGWEALVEVNRVAMLDAGLWGVPSFRLLDEQGEPLLALWGQDRLWLFAREIQRQLGKRRK